MFNKKTNNTDFSESEIQAVWQKGRYYSGTGQNEYRLDICGNLMLRSAYGNTDSKHGWEIDHIYPKSRGGSDALSNLQPLQWENNRRKADQYPWNCY